MKKIIFLLLATIGTGGVIAQSCSGSQMSSKQMANEQPVSAFGIVSSESLTTVQGGEFINQAFTLGNVYENGNLLLKNVPLRYNPYADEFEVKQISAIENSELLFKNPGISVKMSNAKYVFIEDNNEENGYFKIVTSGKHYDLLKKSVTTYLPARAAKTRYDVAQPAKFVTKDTYYLMSKDGELGELPTRSNKVSKMLTNRTKEVKKFIDTNRLDLEKDTDMARLINYYNSII